MRSIPKLFFYSLDEILRFCFTAYFFQRADEPRFLNNCFVTVIGPDSIQCFYSFSNTLFLL